jgi:hypothetical protein
MNISGVALRREAIITNVNPGPLNIDVLDVQRVEKVGIFGKSSSISRASSADNVLEGDVLG